MKKVLLDTNVVIHREKSNINRTDIGLLFRWLDKLRYEKCIHRVTVAEIRRHEDLVVRETMAVKLDSYSELKTLAPEDAKIKKVLAEDVTENDRNDTLLLNEVHAGRVDCLITEDKGLHRKAGALLAQGRVFTIEDFLSKVDTENPALTTYKVLSVRDSLFGKLKLSDSFFDSFKEDYGHARFEKWFNNKANETVYVSTDEENGVVAFLYLKIEREDENYSDIQPAFSRKKRLKVGTFKVISTGHKLGERFLKIVFDNAMKSRVEEIYVTIFETADHLPLIDLLKEWGFVRHGIKTSDSGAEQVYVRDFRAQVSDDIKSSYPFISSEQRKFIVSIRPEYHTDLLPDSILKTERPEDFQALKGHRNAIQKVFISRSIQRDMCPNDIVVFYRTGGYHTSVVTTIGVIESVVKNISDADKFIELCRKRSVFSDDELLEHWNYNAHNRPFIVNFLYVYSFPAPRLNMAKLIELGVIADVRSAPRGFEPLSDRDFNLILEHSNADKSFIVDQT